MRPPLLRAAFWSLLVAAFFARSFVGTAQAAGTHEAFQVTMTGGGVLAMKPGEKKQVQVEYKNTGTVAWANTGAQYVSLYTYGPKYRASVFKDASWFASTQPAKLKEAKVAPDKVGTVQFTLKAPVKTGTYKETFQLAAEDKSWIAGSTFTLTINVGDQPSPTPAPVPVSAATPALGASVLLRSAKNISVPGNGKVDFTVGIKNTGTKTWMRRELHKDAPTSSDIAAAKAEANVEPGGLDLFTFSFNAPSGKGSFIMRYVLVVDGEVIPDFYVDIPVEVTSEAYAVPSPFVFIPYVPGILDAEAIITEPMMRVGILIVDGETNDQVIVSCRSPWELRTVGGAVLASLDAGRAVTAFYKKGSYWYNAGTELQTASGPLRFVSSEQNGICDVINWDRRVTRGSDRAYNAYRNVLELRYNGTKDRTWLINELPMEWYLKGLGETSNISHPEFQKALLVAARTFALYHWERGTKRGAEGFHVTGYADDQVYRGYGQEEASPILTQSVENTRGRVLTFEGRTALAPYFSRSDGRTRDWSEVWGGSVAWLKSVSAPCDAQRSYALWGHGVGMSASEALCQANKGVQWRDILGYFYSGTTVLKHWN